MHAPLEHELLQQSAGDTHEAPTLPQAGAAHLLSVHVWLQHWSHAPHLAPAARHLLSPPSPPSCALASLDASPPLSRPGPESR
jgi:hypothetical protein